MAISPELEALVGEIDFDPEALRAKYLAERNRRLRADGLSQYKALVSELANFDEDPYVELKSARAPVFDEVAFAIIGGGFGGLLMGAQLRQEGFDDIRLIEAGGDVGGTWYWNRYPGAMCDVESYCYLPLLEELGYIPKHRYSYGPEILEHSRNIARHYRLYDSALLQTKVAELCWDENAQRWIISTNRGDKFKAQYVAMANGPLNRPKVPAIPGIDRFRGRMFHTSRWDYRYTGGDSYGNLTGLTDKCVGIVGTGATAIQCVPSLGPWAKQLYVFQRTPSSVDLRHNSETDLDWAASLTPGWQVRRMANFNALCAGVDQDEDLVHDGWTDLWRNLSAVGAEKAIGRQLEPEERDELIALLDYKKMNQIRALVDSTVAAPETAELLKPWYRLFCKRPCFHDAYLQTFNRPNVRLVQGKGLERLSEYGAVADGQEFLLDCLIFATGFEVGTSYTQRAGYDIIGRDGRKLSHHWSHGLRTLHGLMSHGFPNCFFIGYTQTAHTVNIPFALREQTNHIRYMVSAARSRGYSMLEPTTAGEDAYVAEIRAAGRPWNKLYNECTPSYVNFEGAQNDNYFSESYGGGSVAFFQMLEDWRSEGRMEGIQLR
jgi:cation diffusion facilitator CzcD-associated flavoprotein CzcO